jgi:hypothetical protein
MNVASDIAALRNWLREDESRLRSPQIEARGTGTAKEVGNFDDWHNHGKSWANGPSNAPFSDFNDWSKR